ncbi:MAG TPA: hypothetical protein VK206_23465, partial [Anaerolineales bacterium]|nr:hypothetical protein [Anaerolineales bacterium]
GNGVIVLWDFNAKNSRLLLKSVPAADMALSGAWNYSGKATSTSPDGKTAAVSTCSQTETQFESNAACVISEIDFDGVKIRDFPRADAVGDASLVTAMALSPNGALLAVGICRDFDFFDPKPASCSPGEVWLVWIKDRSAGRVESIRLGDHPYAVTDLAFTQDGRILTSTGQNGDTMRWDMSPEAWQTYACEIAERNFTQVEWNEQFFSGQPYPGKDLTCPQYPAGE